MWSNMADEKSGKSSDSTEPTNSMEMDEEEDVFEVEKIMGQIKTKSGQILYKVRWVGYGPDHDTFEPYDNLSSCQEMLDEFIRKQDEKKRDRKRRRAQQEQAHLEAEQQQEDSGQGGSKDDKRKPLWKYVNNEEAEFDTLKDKFWRDLDEGKINVFESGDMYSKVKATGGRASRPQSFTQMFQTKIPIVNDETKERKPQTATRGKGKGSRSGSGKSKQRSKSKSSTPDDEKPRFPGSQSHARKFHGHHRGPSTSSSTTSSNTTKLIGELRSVTTLLNDVDSSSRESFEGEMLSSGYSMSVSDISESSQSCHLEVKEDIVGVLPMSVGVVPSPRDARTGSKDEKVSMCKNPEHYGLEANLSKPGCALNVNVAADISTGRTGFDTASHPTESPVFDACQQAKHEPVAASCVTDSKLFACRVVLNPLTEPKVQGDSQGHLLKKQSEAEGGSTEVVQSGPGVFEETTREVSEISEHDLKDDGEILVIDKDKLSVKFQKSSETSTEKGESPSDSLDLLAAKEVPVETKGSPVTSEGHRSCDSDSVQPMPSIDSGGECKVNDDNPSTVSDVATNDITTSPHLDPQPSGSKQSSLSAPQQCSVNVSSNNAPLSPVHSQDNVANRSTYTDSQMNQIEIVELDSNSHRKRKLEPHPGERTMDDDPPSQKQPSSVASSFSCLTESSASLMDAPSTSSATSSSHCAMDTSPAFDPNSIPLPPVSADLALSASSSQPPTPSICPTASNSSVESWMADNQLGFHGNSQSSQASGTFEGNLSQAGMMGYQQISVQPQSHGLSTSCTPHKSTLNNNKGETGDEEYEFDLDDLDPLGWDGKIVPKVSLPEVMNLTNSELRQLVRANDYDRLLRALRAKKPYDLEQPDHQGVTPVMIAAQNGFDDVLELLMLKGANINAETKNGMTPLIMACEQGLRCTVALLLEMGAKMNHHSHGGETALIKAVKRGHKNIVRQLLDHGANFASPYNLDTPLKWAKLNLEISEMLNSHISRLKTEFEHQVQITLNNTARMSCALFPMQCFALRESEKYRVLFKHELEPTKPGIGMLLFVAHARMTSQEVRCRFYGPCAVMSAVLNGVKLGPLTEEGNYVMSFCPLHNGRNELEVHTAKAPTSKAKLIVCAYKAELV